MASTVLVVACDSSKEKDGSGEHGLHVSSSSGTVMSARGIPRRPERKRVQELRQCGRSRVFTRPSSSAMCPSLFRMARGVAGQKRGIAFGRS
eukprot:scaffold2115_cov171-Pinguiococcus_pyrenoidosus.AAC.2